MKEEILQTEWLDINGKGDYMKLIINNKPVETNVRPDEFLLETLRRLGYLSVKEGCQSSSCGVCSVLLEKEVILSCTYLAIRAEGKNITTIEGVRDRAKDFIDLLSNEGADQCGYCSSGLIMTVLAMEEEYSDPTEDEISHYLDGNLCRCTGYKSQIRSVKKYFDLKNSRGDRVW